MILIGLFLSTFAIPITTWRTGEADTEPLQVGPSRQASAARLWIDTDAACGLGPRIDPDDCLALLALARPGGPEIAGISTVFGNADLARTDAVTRGLVARLQAAGRQLPAVDRGAAAPLPESARAATAAAEALAGALREEPLTILALGPVTNVASVLRSDPDLAANVVRVVAVMGRRPRHLFHPSEGKGDGLLFGHGPVFSDFSFRKDPDAARVLVSSGAPLTLIPYEAARDVMVTPADIDRLAASGPVGAVVAAAVRDWMAFWRDDIGLPGFYPFDLVAAQYVRNPSGFLCAEAEGRVQAGWAPDWLWPIDSAGLLVTAPGAARNAHPVTYCPEIATDATLVRFN